MSIEVERGNERMVHFANPEQPIVNVIADKGEEDNDFASFANPEKIEETPQVFQMPTPTANLDEDYHPKPPRSPSPVRMDYDTPRMTEEEIRRRKSYVLYEFESKNRDNRYSPKMFNMNSDLQEIENELEYIKSKKKQEESLDFWRRGLIYLTEGAVMLNNHFDPFSAGDMSDWARTMYYTVMKEHSYDDMLLELIEKYKELPSMPVEVRLALMVGGSFGLTVVAKQREKRTLDEYRRKTASRAKTQLHTPASTFAPFPKQEPDLHGPSFTAQEIQNIASQATVESESEAGSERESVHQAETQSKTPSEPITTTIIPEDTTILQKPKRGQVQKRGRGRQRKSGITLELS